MRSAQTPVKAILNLEHNYAALPPAKKQVLSFLIPLVLKPVKPLHSYNVEAAAAYKKQLKIPVVVVGGIRKLDEMEKILEEDHADYISLCRPLIIEPGLANKFKEGLQKESKCIDCSYCLLAANSNPLRCYHGKIPAAKTADKDLALEILS